MLDNPYKASDTPLGRMADKSANVLASRGRRLGARIIDELVEGLIIVLIFSQKIVADLLNPPEFGNPISIVHFNVL